MPNIEKFLHFIKHSYMQRMRPCSKLSILTVKHPLCFTCLKEHMGAKNFLLDVKVCKNKHFSTFVEFEIFNQKHCKYGKMQYFAYF